MYINDKSNTLKKYNVIKSPSGVELAYLTFSSETPKTLTIGKDIVNSITHKQTDLTFKNAMYINNGFSVVEKYRNKGLGERIFKLLFETHPEIENVLFYSNDKRAINFWKKIGAEIVLENSSLKLMNLKNSKTLNETKNMNLLLENFSLYEVKVILKSRKSEESKLTTIYNEIRAVPYVVIAHPVKDVGISARSNDNYEYAQILLKFLVKGDYMNELEAIKNTCLHGIGDSKEFKIKGLVAFVPRIKTLQQSK